MEIIDQTAKVVMLKGEGGDTIKSIDKTTTQGLVDIYTITLESGNKTTFNVTNGNGIKTIEKTSTSGLIDTYTITFDNGETTTFNVTNGEKGEKGDKGDTGPQGPKGEKGDPGDGGGIANIDTELSTTSTNPVQNKAIAEGINKIQNQIVPTASIEVGDTASKAYSDDDYLVKDGILYKVIQDIAKDNALTVGTNIAMTTVGSELSSIKSNKSFEEIATATANGNVTTTKSLSEFNGFMFMLTVTASSYPNVVLQTTFVTREIFEMEGTSLFATDDIGSYRGRVKRVDDNTVNFFDLRNVKKVYLIGFY